MEMQPWIKLLGKSQDDKAVQSALTAAGVSKPPKLARGDVSVIVDLKGRGMGLKLVDEAFLRGLKDQDVGEGPLILTLVSAYIFRRKNRDLYKGTLPYALRPDMTRADVQRTLGRPTSSDEDVPYDAWLRDGVELVVGYTQELTLGHVTVQLPE